MGQREAGPAARTRVIDSADRRLWPDLPEVWRYRELLFFLAWRDVQLRYRQTLLGGLWALLQPLLTTALLTAVFSSLASFSQPGIPYPAFCYAGFVIWIFFSTGVQRATTSLASQSHVLSKVYFPRVLVPIATILGGLPDLAVASVGMAVLMIVYRVVPGPALLAFPAAVLVAVLTTLAVGIWLAALGARYRDIRHAIPFVIQLGMLASPVFYPASLVAHRFGGWLLLNPITAMLEFFRWSLGLGSPPQPGFLLASTAAVLALLALGLVYFQYATRDFVDAG